MSDDRCPPMHELLALATGEPASAEVERHVSECPDCGKNVSELSNAVNALGKAACDGLAPTIGYTATGHLQPDFQPGERQVNLAIQGAVPVLAPGPGAEPKPPPAVPFPASPITADGTTDVGPRQIGQYVVVSLISDRGGQADVYRAIHTRLNKELVVKWSRQPVRAGQHDRDRLVQEGRLLASLDHPNLIRVHDLGVHEDRAFLVTEWVPGLTLTQQARRRRYSAREVAELMITLSRAMAYGHGRGVLHLDFKPDNVLIDENGRTRIIDFGLARLDDFWSGPAAERGSVNGTPPFMAPEQARGDAERIDARSDIFALGATLYFLLTGRQPFEEKTLQVQNGRWAIFRVRKRTTNRL